MNKQLARKSFLIILIRFITPLFGLISLVLVKRYLGYEAVGMLAFAASFVALFSIFSDLGFGSAHLKKYNDESLDKAKCNGTLITTKLFLNVFSIVLILSFIFFLKTFTGYNFESRTLEILVYLAVVSLFFKNLKSMYTNLTTARLEIAINFVPTMSFISIQMVLKVFFVLMGFGVLYVAGAEVIAFIILSIMLYNFVQYPVVRTDWNYIKIYSKFAFPVMFIGILLTYAKNIDKVMLQYFLDSEFVGIYVIPQRLTTVYLLISSGIVSLLLPTFSSLYAKKKFKDVSKITNKSVKYISMSLIPALIFTFVFAEFLLILLFGHDASKSADVLKIFLITCYIDSIRRPYSIQLVSSEHLSEATWLSVLLLSMNVGLNLIFIPDEFLGFKMLDMGVEGAALATLFSLSVNTLFVVYFSYKITGTIFYSSLWKHIISGLLVLLLTYQVFFVLAETWYLVFASFFPLLLAYLGLLFLLNEFTREDMDFYFANLNPMKMWFYLKSMK